MAAGCGGAHSQRAPRGAVYRRHGLLPRAQHELLLTQTVHKKQAVSSGLESTFSLRIHLSVSFTLHGWTTSRDTTRSCGADVLPLSMRFHACTILVEEE
jgi:hypothetical protein